MDIFGDALPGAPSAQQIERCKSRHEWNLTTHISLKNRYVYIQVSKAGSSTVKYYLQKKEFEGTQFTVQDVNNRRVSPHISPYQLSETAFLNILGSDEFRKVSVVRNPYSRLLSCYLHRIVGNPDSASARWYRRCFGGPADYVPSFDEFIINITNQESREMELHWRVQSDELLFDQLKYSFVARMEDFPSSLGALGDHIFGKPGFAFDSLGSINASPMQTNAKSQVETFYNASLIDRVAERFVDDFANFGYEPRELDHIAPCGGAGCSLPSQ